MRSTGRTLVLIGILLLVGVSCQETGTIKTPVGTEGYIAWWTRWLTQPACQLPCWQYITPGMTTRQEAISLLEDNSDVAITYNGEYGLSWNFGNATDVGNIRISANGKVSSIWLGSSSNISLHLDQVVEAYGYPQFIQPYDCREGMCSTALVYPELGMFLNVYIENTGTGDETPQLEIGPDAIVNRVYFIETGIESFLEPNSSLEPGELMEWQGYGEYP